MQNLTKLQKLLGYEFQNKAWLTQALTHRSAGKNHNERLEFIGDGILNLTIAVALFAQFPKCNEGELSRMRATLVREQTLVEFAKVFQLSDQLVLGSGELKSGGFRRESILADAVEAIIGAIYLDQNQDLNFVTQLIKTWYQDLLANIKPGENQKDPKTRLQEYLQGKGIEVPIYTVLKTTGQAHCQTFYVRCEVPKLGKSVEACGTSRRKAEQKAASIIFQDLNSK